MSNVAIALGGLVGLFFFLVCYLFLVPKNNRGFAPSNEKQLADNSALRFFTGLTNEIMLALPASEKQLKETKRDVKTEQLLVRSGNPWGVTVSEFKTLRMVGMVVGFIVSWPIGLAVLYATPAPTWVLFVIVALVTFFGFYMPMSKHNDLVKTRDLEFKRQLPESLDLITIALSGGLSFPRALESSLPSMQDGIVKDEFALVVKDISAGTTLDEALDKFANRAPNDSVKTFVRAVQAATKTNAPLAEILESRARASREEFFAYIHQKVAQLESKIWMILSPTMLPALMIITIMPSSTVMMQALG